MSERQFQRRLRQILLEADAAAFDLEGGWDVQTDADSLDLSVEITRVDK